MQHLVAHAALQAQQLFRLKTRTNQARRSLVSSGPVNEESAGICQAGS
jgi:hypothetical protein